jgi:hypothetical protein
MTESCHTLIGLVEIVPHSSSSPSVANDENTLQGWFDRATEGHDAQEFAATGQPVICKSDRWSRDAQTAGNSGIVRADLSQLLVDLEREYQNALRRQKS